MVDNTAAFMGLDNQSQGAIAPFVATGLNLSAIQGPMLSLLQKINTSMPWVPANLANIGAQVFALGGFPRLRRFLPGERRPPWLADQNNYNAWQTMISQGYSPIDAAFAAKNLALAAQQTQASLANVAMWDAIAQYSGANALESLWNDLWNAIQAIKAQRSAAITAQQVSSTIINTYGAAVPPELVNQTAAISDQIAQLDAQARAALAPIPTAAPQVGLGMLPIIIAGIAAATITTVAAAAWAIAQQFANVQINAANNAQALMQWRDQADNAAAAAGQITNAELIARRQQTIAAGNSVVNAQGAAAIGTAAGKFGFGTALGIGSVVAFGIGALLLFRFARPKRS
jgi:hypothetical protein